MSTNLKNIKGVFKKVVFGDDDYPMLKFAYFSHIAGNDSDKRLKMYTINKPFNTDSAIPNECIISSNDRLERVNSSFVDTTYRADNVMFNSFSDYTFKPNGLMNTSSILTPHTKKLNCTNMVSSYNMMMFYVLFYCSFNNYDFDNPDEYLCLRSATHKICNNGLLMQINRNNITSLGGGYWVTNVGALTQNFSHSDTTYQNFSIPSVALVKYTYESGVYNLTDSSRYFRVQDIAIAYHT